MQEKCLHRCKINRLTLAAKQISLPGMTTLLPDIRAFCETHSLPITRFGELAMNDTAFVHKLEKGRRVWPETEAKARAFMAAYAKDAAA